MDGPIPFITLSAEAQKARKEGKDTLRKFEINEKACEILAAIKTKVVVITIAGMYRTGKSFILNRLAGSTIGFDIGSTIEPCTQGIWMWVVNPKKISFDLPKDVTVVLIDTEGLGSYTKSKTYDIQIFAISVLLCSFFIYNSMGSIDETAIDRLSLVVELTKHIRAQSDGDETATDLNAFFPKFMWLVRDFSLKLQSGGRDITPKEYLENSLAPLPGDPERVKDKNLIRTSITQFFSDRNCFTMKRPVNDEKLLQHLDTAKEEDFRSQFIEELEIFTKFVFTNARPKRLYGENLNGEMFVQLTRNYVQAINEGSIPTIRTAWQNVLEIENQKAISASFKVYEGSLKHAFENDKILEEEELAQVHKDAVDKSMEVFLQMVKGSNYGPFEKKLMNQIDEFHKRYLEINISRSVQLCEKMLDEIVAGISQSVEDGTVKSIEVLQDQWNSQIETKYVALAKGPRKDAVLANFLKRKPLEHARKLSAKMIKLLEEKHEKEIAQVKSEAQNEVGRIEKLYEDTMSSWNRTKSDLQFLEEENQQLIKSIVHISEAI